jgi:methionine synthase II (cobalamin-independent)
MVTAMNQVLKPDSLPVLVGSFPTDDHDEALRLVFEHTPEVPVWAQLPVYTEEGMIPQFLPGMPGLTFRDESFHVDTTSDRFDAELLAFYESYISVMEGKEDLSASRFAIGLDTAKGFVAFLEKLAALKEPPVAVKGQVTGPITFCTGTHNQDKIAIFYDERLRDAAVKLLSLKARYQVERLAEFGSPVIIFVDEPALAGYGSSELISISKEEVSACLEEVFEAIHTAGGLAGIHVCANTDWSLIMDTSVDIINFDAYAYFDRFILYAEKLKAFFDAGGIVAWGIVPTLNAEDIEKETADSLYQKLEEIFDRVMAIGINRETLLAQSLIAPSCGTGSTSLDLAKKVLKLTRELSERLRNQN